MIPGKNILTELTVAFKTVAENAVSIVMPIAQNLLLGITLIAIITTIITYLAMEDSRSTDILFYVKKAAPNLFKYASFTFIVTYYGVIVNALISSFFKIGGIAGGTAISEGLFSDPSKITDIGLNLMLPVWNNYITKNLGYILTDITLLVAGAATGGITSIAVKVVNVLMGGIRPNSLVILAIMIMITVLVIACFFIMAVNVFVIQIEFAIIASLFLILMPFGAWDKTEFIFNNAKSTFINLGIKYMVLTTILSISMSIISGITLTDYPTYVELLYFLLMVVGVTALTVLLPSRLAAEL